MSNHLAVATVSAALQNLLAEEMASAGFQAKVTVGQPIKPVTPNATPQINICLYQVTHSQTLRNETLPGRSPYGQLRARPTVVLDLSYLISFYGNESTYDPQRLLGCSAIRLNETPLLSKAAIEAAIEDNMNVLTNSNLADALEPVRITPLNLTVDDYSRLWSVFFQLPQALSMAYQAAVVILESEEIPITPLPVLERQIGVIPLRRPHIHQIRGNNPEQPAITATSSLIVTGENLLGDTTLLHIDSATIALNPTKLSQATQEQLELPLSEIAPSLAAGVHTLQIAHQSAEFTSAGVRSNLVPFVLQPTLSATIDNDNLRVDPLPPIQPDQAVRLLFDPLPGQPELDACEITVPPADSEQDELLLPLAEIPAGQYRLRLQVDGATSPLKIDSDLASPTYRQFVGPHVTIPGGVAP